MKTPHYLRFVQALALAAVVPGCVGAEEPASPPAAESQIVGQPNPNVSDLAPVQQNDIKELVARPIQEPLDHGTGGAGGAFSSGPIVPPELPRGFA